MFLILSQTFALETELLQGATIIAKPSQSKGWEVQAPGENRRKLNAY